MSELKTRPATASVANFIGKQPQPRSADCDAVAAMMQAATGEAAMMWGDGIVGFGRYAYSNSMRKTFEWPIIGFSPRKNDLTLYLTPGFEGFPELMARPGKYKIGKSCLYLKRLADVDQQVLLTLIEAVVIAMEPQPVR